MKTDEVGYVGFAPVVTIGKAEIGNHDVGQPGYHNFCSCSNDIPVGGEGCLCPAMPDPTLITKVLKEIPDYYNECQEVWRHPNGATLWLGNKVGALTFVGKIICVLEDPHCQHSPNAIHIPILGDDGRALRSRLDDAAEEISAALYVGLDTLVHCSAGMERSPLTVAWWMVKENVVPDIQTAYKILMVARPVVQDREHWIEGNSISEQHKYQKMWQHEQYRIAAPGEGLAQIFLQHARPKPGSTVIDFGAGTGRGALMLAIMGGMKVKMLDFADNCLDLDVKNALVTQSHMLEFIQHDLTQKVPVAAEYGFCTDVMEHIPPQDVGLVLQNVLRAAQHCFFQISCEPDNMGKLIGEPLHLTVQPYSWWLEAFKQLDCAIHWSKDHGTHCLFYVSSWQSGKAITETGVLNHAEELCMANVKENIKGDWLQAEPYQPNDDVEVAILGGGWSLEQSLDEIKILKAAGVKIVTLNGAYQWALEHDLGPVTQIMVDARPHNARFVQPVREDCLYMIASQCDPGVFAQLPVHRTMIWHTSEKLFKEMLDERYPLWYNVPGGSTVLLRAIPLLRMLGYRKFHLFGCDSCLKDDQHHSYAQPENDGDLSVPVNVAGRTFNCFPWMASQASEFMDLIKVFQTEIELEVYGDGLLAHILTAGAESSDEVLALP